MTAAQQGTRIRAAVLVSIGLLAGRAWAIPSPVAEGPIPYTGKADSPHDTSAFGYCVENFENSVFDVPGATINGDALGPGGLTDSVDEDDGTIDGSGNGGHSWLSVDGPGGITVTFDPSRANGLPTTVGIVWTDGGGTVSFEAFDADGQSLGVNGPNDHADAGSYGTTAEDRYYGETWLGGISRIHLSNTVGGIEVDHVQLNRCILCGDTNFDLKLSAGDALFALKTSVGAETCRGCVCDANNNGSTSVTDALAILKKSVGLSPTMNCPTCEEFVPL